MLYEVITRLEPARMQAQPRRLKQLERGSLKPAETLDLHGLSREEALARTRTFLEHAARQGWTAVVIVTGKGLNSPNGPVLRQAVEQLLTELPQLILEWVQAPRPYGGGGVITSYSIHYTKLYELVGTSCPHRRLFRPRQVRRWYQHSDHK